MIPPASEALRHTALVAEEAVATGVVPGAAVALGRLTEGSMVWRSAWYGAAGQERGAVSTATVYDLASLTKALCTSVLMMQAVAEGAVRLSDPLRKYLSAAPAEVTLAHALTHTTGWPAHRKFYEARLPSAAGVPLPPHAAFAEAIVADVLATPVEARPGTRTLYSDLGFIALGAVLEGVAGMPLDRLFGLKVAGPIGRPGLSFLPAPAAFAPTEQCAWRARLIAGEVHDQNAWLMGGVAGHAGLFGTIDDVAALASALLASFRGGVKAGALVSSETLATFWRHRDAAGGTWALGWDRPSPTGSLAGTRISREAVGHLGFTGCSLWLDFEAGHFVVTLCNRIHPTVRDDPRFRQFRPNLVDAALQDLQEINGA